MSKPPTQKPHDKAYVAVPRELGRQLRIVSAGLNMSVREYAEKHLSSAIDRDMPRVVEQMTAAAK